MTWTLTAAGHAGSPEAETALVERLREVFGPFGGAGGVQSATVATTYHGTVDLLQPGAAQEPPGDVVVGDGSGEALPELVDDEERVAGSTDG